MKIQLTIRKQLIKLETKMNLYNFWSALLMTQCSRLKKVVQKKKKKLSVSFTDVSNYLGCGKTVTIPYCLLFIE
jgi:hypothetical protein